MKFSEMRSRSCLALRTYRTKELNWKETLHIVPTKGIQVVAIVKESAMVDFRSITYIYRLAPWHLRSRGLPGVTCCIKLDGSPLTRLGELIAQPGQFRDDSKLNIWYDCLPLRT